MSSIHELCLARHRRPSDFPQKWGKRDVCIRRKEIIRDVLHLTLHKLSSSLKKKKKRRETKEREVKQLLREHESFIMETSKQTKKDQVGVCGRKNGLNTKHGQVSRKSSTDLA